jgi:L-threonylcarbamoyladenylate synthase
MTEKAVAKAAEVLARGGTAVYPTETVYGIGASVFIPEAVERIFEIKGRDRIMPLSLLRKVLPGPVTILVERGADLLDIVTAGSPLVGIRFPDHPMALELIGMIGPITSTSANLSGQKPPASIEELDPKITSEVDVILDGGRSRFARPSTLFDLAARKVIREGAGMERVLELLG